MEEFLPSIKTEKCFTGCQNTSCSRYHSLLDYRRSTITYSALICLEAVKSGFCTHSNCLHCINYIEYLYHPRIYKTRECISSKLGLSCPQGGLCPYSHRDKGDSKVFNDFTVKNSSELFEVQEKAPKPVSINPIDQVQLAEISEIKPVAMIPAVPLIEELKEKPQPRPANNISQPEDPSKPIFQPEQRLKYIHNKEVHLFEDRYNEFKECRGRSFDVTYACNLLSNYVSAYLNTEGGTIFYGISDSGFVSGVKMIRKTRDLFTQNFDSILNKFRPAVGPEFYSVVFSPIYSKDGAVIPELYVIEIRVKQGDKKKIYYTHREEAYIKRDSSVNQLKGPALVEFARGKES